MTRILLFLLKSTRFLPLTWVRALGAALGWILLLTVANRRKVVRTNLQWCFPNWTEAERDRCMRLVFIRYAQAWCDRGWLWHAPPETLRKRLRVTGAIERLTGTRPVVIFAPHFVGLDAGWTALTQQCPRFFTTIYTNQANQVADAWILAGRRRFPNGRLFGRADGVKSIVSALKGGEPLYLLPDMNFGPEDSLFVPFYGVPAATVPSLSRFSRLAKADVVPVVTRMTANGYDVEVMPPWEDFPTADMLADTRLMNERLQGFIDTMPEQYFWVHKRFKDRPEGEVPPY